MGHQALRLPVMVLAGVSVEAGVVVEVLAVLRAVMVVDLVVEGEDSSDPHTRHYSCQYLPARPEGLVDIRRALSGHQEMPCGFGWFVVCLAVS